MVTDTVQTSWKRSTDPGKGVGSDYTDDGAKEPEKTPAQQLTKGSAFPQSTTQTPQSGPIA